MAFHFPLMPRLFMALRLEDRHPITDIMAQTPPIPETCQWGLFLRNHDELTLEMVSDEERDYMYLAYSADPKMRINIGIRRRLAPLMENNRRRIELLNSLLFSFPGTPILYYGDELGMGDNIYLGDRNGVRTPMQWNSDRNAGFSRATPTRLRIRNCPPGSRSLRIESFMSRRISAERKRRGRGASVGSSGSARAGVGSDSRVRAPRVNSSAVVPRIGSRPPGTLPAAECHCKACAFAHKNSN
jgi:glycosidase